MLRWVRREANRVTDLVAKWCKQEGSGMAFVDGILNAVRVLAASH